MSVKRYTYHTIPYEHYMGEKGEKEYAPAGDYVRWEDYAALLAATQWRPIETAPKDGTWVLLCWKETPTGSECFDEWSPGQAVGKWYYDGWMRCSEYSVGGNPTHWMPLPKPPSV